MEILSFFNGQYATYRLLSARSADEMRIAIRNFNRFLGRESRLDDLSDDALNGLAGWMLKRGRSRTTINKTLRGLLAIARFARRRKIIEYRPDIEYLPEFRPSANTWRIEEFQRLLRNAARLPGFWGPLVVALLRVLYDTGLRISDALRIERRDCDLNLRIVRLVEGKTGKHRAFVLHPDTIAAIELCGRRGGKLLPYPYVTTTPLRKVLRVALKAAGLPHGRRNLFHCIRRTVATLAKAAGMNATQVLGHSAAWVTEAYYVDHSQQPPMDIASRLPPLPRHAPDPPQAAG